MNNAYIQRFMLAFVVLFGLTYTISQFWMIAINSTDSVEHKVFIVRKGVIPDAKGQYIVFQPHDKGPAPFIKLVGGTRGDTVTREGRSYYVSGKYVGDAKEFSKSGEPTKLGPVGVIPQGSYFVYTGNKDSYDSRYEGIGWVKSSDVIGVAYAVY